MNKLNIPYNCDGLREYNYELREEDHDSEVSYKITIKDGWLKPYHAGQFTFNIDDFLSLSLAFSIIEGAQSFHLKSATFNPEYQEIWYEVNFYVEEKHMSHRFQQFIWFSITSHKNPSIEATGQIDIKTKQSDVSRVAEEPVNSHNTSFNITITHYNDVPVQHRPRYWPQPFVSIKLNSGGLLNKLGQLDRRSATVG